MSKDPDRATRQDASEQAKQVAALLSEQLRPADAGPEELRRLREQLLDMRGTMDTVGDVAQDIRLRFTRPVVYGKRHSS